MRLSAQHLEVIKATFKTLFPEGDALWLFGSRVDDLKKGGDIDLYIETSLPLSDAHDQKNRLVVALWKTLGEQKIDVVLNVKSSKIDLPIYHVARTEGVQLV